MNIRLSGLLLLVLVSLTGCRPEAPAKPAPPATDASPKGTSTVSVAAASDLKFAFDELVRDFEKASPETKVTVTYGASGKFFAQLSNKAPFDLFLSADIAYPQKLIEQGHAAAGSEFHYADGQIVLWVRNDSPINLEESGAKAVLDPSVRKVAIANPEHAPYGRAAQQALKSLDLYTEIEPKLVLGENIAQTAQFVESGGADIGVLALSLAMAPALSEKGRYWIIPASAYQPIRQGGVILNWAADRPAAERLRDHLLSERGRAALSHFGFHAPGE